MSTDYEATDNEPMTIEIPRRNGLFMLAVYNQCRNGMTKPTNDRISRLAESHNVAALTHLRNYIDNLLEIIEIDKQEGAQLE
jgi:hypothetical protein